MAGETNTDRIRTLEREISGLVSQTASLNVSIERAEEKIDVLRDSLSGCQGTQKCNALYTRTETRSPHKGISPKK